MIARRMPSSLLIVTSFALFALLVVTSNPRLTLHAQSATPAATKPVLNAGEIVYTDHSFGTAATTVTLLDSAGKQRLQLAVPLKQGRLQSSSLSPDGKSIAVIAQSAQVPAANLYVVSL